MTNEILETIFGILFFGIPIGSFALDLGYMLWKGL